MSYWLELLAALSNQQLGLSENNEGGPPILIPSINHA